MGSHREQYIWKRGVKMSINCYKITQIFPNSELYDLTSKIRRSCVSVPSNIAEGYGRTSKPEYIRFFRIALGYLRELDTQLIIAKAVNLAKPELFIPTIKEVDELQRLIIATIHKLDK
ncbi:MAG: four helix bundle protein [Trichodesmium sp. MO_231.B1]|nr:four helix bundle protein [Trichodesmium sp. MO_231.B1]